MLKTSEWVSIGHPDKIADYISSYILDRYLEKDKYTRYALETQIKDEFVTLGGEITSTHNFTSSEIEEFVKSAVNEIGYTKDYQNYWGKENTICGDDLVITQHISKQSSDISQGVNQKSWGDQGLYFGYANNNTETNFMPKDHAIAKAIGEKIFTSGIGGLDVKTQVTMCDDYVSEIVVAVPLKNTNDIENIKKLINSMGYDSAKLIINGTGRYVKHSSIGDCGTTGRKLVVDFYGGNCKIGGGSPWTKDATKADVTLNIYARVKALEFLKRYHLEEVYCAISSVIGKKEIAISYFDSKNKNIATAYENHDSEDIITLLNLREPNFATMCRHGLFSQLN